MHITPTKVVWNKRRIWLQDADEAEADALNYHAEIGRRPNVLLVNTLPDFERIDCDEETESCEPEAEECGAEPEAAADAGAVESEDHGDPEHGSVIPRRRGRPPKPETIQPNPV